MKMKIRLKLSAMTVFFAMLLGFAVMSIVTEQAYAMEGDGSTENPYEISSYAELKDFAGIVSGTHTSIKQNTSACAILTEDIVCDDELWVPIGTQFQYTGTFNGQGYTIKKLSNGECTDIYQGLFGCIGSIGTVRDVGLEDIGIKGSSNVGGVAGANDGGTITNCYNAGAVSGVSCVGGVVGYNKGGTIENCYNTGAVSGHISVGGVAGYNNGEVTIKNCYNIGAVSGKSFVGGVSGDNSGGTIENCYNTGNVSGTGTNVGGVAGNNSEVTIKNCYNTGNVSGTGDASYNVGGVSGLNSGGTIENCYNTGAVSGTGDASYNVGGVAGNISEVTIKNCYNTGAVSGTGSNVGGVAGYKPPNEPIENCYYDTDLCKEKKAIGNADDTDNVKGLTTKEMTGMGALENMVFAYVAGETSPWMEKENDFDARYYPHLKGFNFDGDGKQMDAKDISVDNWPSKTDALVVETPTFTPADGDFGPQQSIAISCTTDGAAIYYTTDGSDPTTSSNKYTEPITISDTTTIKAMAAKEWFTNSRIASATYTHIHKYGDWTKLNATHHQKVCEHDKSHVIKENHKWDAEWSTDGDKHWHECTVCGKKNGETVHTWVDATCTEAKTCEICDTTEGDPLGHKYGEWTNFDINQHQRVCEHDKSHVEKENHKWDSGKVTKKATEKAEGEKTFTCTICKATKTETIPKLKPSAPKTSGTPLAKATVKKKSMTLGWIKIEGAEGYDIFFATCNHSGKKIACKNVKTIKGKKTFKWTKSGPKKGTAYKFYVRAYVTKNGKKTYVSKSPLFHAYTGNGNKKYTNAKNVKLKNVKKGKVSLKQGKTFKIKAKVKKVNKKKKLMPKSHAPTLRYMTSNGKVATVTKSGKITAKGSGTCYIYVYAHNGVSKQIKVTVK